MKILGSFLSRQGLDDYYTVAKASTGEGLDAGAASFPGEKVMGLRTPPREYISFANSLFTTSKDCHSSLVDKLLANTVRFPESNTLVGSVQQAIDDHTFESAVARRHLHANVRWEFLQGTLLADDEQGSSTQLRKLCQILYKCSMARVFEMQRRLSERECSRENSVCEQIICVARKQDQRIQRRTAYSSKTLRLRAAV